MKRFFAAILCLCLLAGCGRTDSTGNTRWAEETPDSGDMSGKTEKPGESAEPAGETFRIVREEKDGLLLARVGGGPADVYTLSLPDTGVTLDGEAFDRNEPGAYQALPGSTLTGALAEITYGTVLETYPGQLGGVTAVNIRPDGFDDRCALYLRVLDDLWNVDGGLNGGVTSVSVDLSQTSLSESEQAAVAWAFAGEHGISDPLTLSHEELAAEGYLTGADPDSDGMPCWENGCLFTVTEQETGDNELNGARDTVTFDAQKWRSALGAYFFCDCTASQDIDGRWGDYTVGSQAIS
ncbi:MAG: hypothetical protein PUF98_02410 [Oscillibacter sp.]|nr:hypothetical protein [Oscillibacter sp.]